MEPLNILEFWRSFTGGDGGATEPTTLNVRTTTYATETTIGATEPDKKLEENEDDDDEGSFFDLEFTVPDNDDRSSKQKNEISDSGEDDGDSDSAATDGERENNFTVSSGFSCSRTDPKLSFSPSDDLFFRGSVVQLEQSSSSSSEPDSKPRHQFHVSLLKSATKFRVFMLGFKKTKSEKLEEINGGSPTVLKQKSQKQTKFEMLQKIRVEEVPIISPLTRENNLRNKINKQSNSFDDHIATEEKKLGKDVVQKYLKMIKPLYVRVSKRYDEKSRFTGPVETSPEKSSPMKKEGEFKEKGEIFSNSKSLKQGNLPAGLRVVCKHLGKSRSASSSALASAAAAGLGVPFQAKRRDDSLLQQEDGIQSAILHCKRSFNSSRDSSLLSRSVSDPSHEKSIDFLRNSSAFIKGKGHV